MGYKHNAIDFTADETFDRAELDSANVDKSTCCFEAEGPSNDNGTSAASDSARSNVSSAVKSMALCLYVASKILSSEYGSIDSLIKASSSRALFFIFSPNLEASSFSSSA